MDTYYIISVEIINGNTLNPKWHSPMQKITTDKGVFIDNEPDTTFNRKFNSGFDWKTKKGQTVQAKEIINSNQKWLNFTSMVKEPEDNLVTTSALAKQIGITTKEIKQKLFDSGYLELREGKYQLSSKGHEAGGQPRVSKKYGPYIMWPSTLKP